MEGEDKLRKLLIKATRDLSFREKFLEKPVDIGKEYGVKFTEKQLEAINNTNVFIDEVVALRLICDPRLCYPPVFDLLRDWKEEVLIDLIIKKKWPIPYYPVPPMFKRRHQ